MNTKPFAIKLVNRFRDVDLLSEFEGMDFELAKECAEIALDELMISTSDQKKHDFYKEVLEQLLILTPFDGYEN